FAPLNIFLIREPNRNEEDILEFYTNIVQPDLQLLCDYEDDIDEKDRFKGIPRLLVEILSPSTRKKDVWNKLHLYSESGIEEYWIVDLKYKTISVHTFPDGDSRPDAVFKADESAESTIFEGLKVPLERLF
ncbi:MAG TPA: prevent-host-death protein, partial [Spirochaeta sp.]|nr:prevent-host-death protein [Spirochaeta sp.]